MNWWRAIWQAVLAFFAALQDKEDPQDIQDRINQETQEEIDEVSDETDDELLDTAESLGIVQPESTGGARNHKSPTSVFHRYPKAPWKADD